MRGFVSLFQTAAGAWHVPSILSLAGWIAASAVAGAFIFANLKVNRDDRIRAYQKEQQLLPRTISAEQRATFISATEGGPFGPVVLVTRTPFPNKEEENFTMQLRKMLNDAGFGNKEFDIINGFSTGADPEKFLEFVSHGDTPPPYFSNVASGLYKLGLVSPDIPVAVNNANAKEGVLYLFVPEK